MKRLQVSPEGMVKKHKKSYIFLSIIVFVMALLWWGLVTLLAYAPFVVVVTVKAYLISALFMVIAGAMRLYHLPQHERAVWKKGSVRIAVAFSCTGLCVIAAAMLYPYCLPACYGILIFVATFYAYGSWLYKNMETL